MAPQKFIDPKVLGVTKVLEREGQRGHVAKRDYFGSFQLARDVVLGGRLASNRTLNWVAWHAFHSFSAYARELVAGLEPGQVFESGKALVDGKNGLLVPRDVLAKVHAREPIFGIQGIALVIDPLYFENSGETRTIHLYNLDAITVVRNVAGNEEIGKPDPKTGIAVTITEGERARYLTLVHKSRLKTDAELAEYWSLQDTRNVGGLSGIRTISRSTGHPYGDIPARYVYTGYDAGQLDVVMELTRAEFDGLGF